MSGAFSKLMYTLSYAKTVYENILETADNTDIRQIILDGTKNYLYGRLNIDSSPVDWFTDKDSEEPALDFALMSFGIDIKIYSNTDTQDRIKTKQNDLKVEIKKLKKIMKAHDDATIAEDAAKLLQHDSGGGQKASHQTCSQTEHTKKIKKTPQVIHFFFSQVK
jgi:hypothetical protein